MIDGGSEIEILSSRVVDTIVFDMFDPSDIVAIVARLVSRHTWQSLDRTLVGHACRIDQSMVIAIWAIG